jgi:putative MATE family efflux protein
MSNHQKTIHLSDHFTTGRLLRYALPSIGMMIFTSVYSVVDGFFVSNIVGKTSFAAVNLILPVLEILGALGYVFGTGGSALVSKELGEGRREEASETFSLMVCTTIAVGVFVAVVGTPLLRPVLRAIGAKGAMLEEAMAYGTILMPAMIIFMLQYMFQAFFITAEKPKLGFAITVIAGLTNMFLDWLFMAVFHWGIRGAALATALAQLIGGAVPIVYFARPNTAALHLGRPRFRFSKIKKAAANGASEFMTTVSLSIVSICYNMQLIRFAGQDGVAAYGVIMYVNFIFLAVFIGYATGTAPIVGFHFGAGHKDELHGILKRSLSLIAVTGLR